MINLPDRKYDAGFHNWDKGYNDCLDEVISLNPDPQPVPLPTHEGLWIMEGESTPVWIAFNETCKPYYRFHGGYCKVGRWLEVHLPKFPEPEKPPVPTIVTLWQHDKTGEIRGSHQSEPVVGEEWTFIGDYKREATT